MKIYIHFLAHWAHLNKIIRHTYALYHKSPCTNAIQPHPFPHQAAPNLTYLNQVMPYFFMQRILINNPEKFSGYVGRFQLLPRPKLKANNLFLKGGCCVLTKSPPNRGVSVIGILIYWIFLLSCTKFVNSDTRQSPRFFWRN